MTDPKFWLDALQWLCTLGMAAVMFLRKPGEDAAAAVASLKRETEATLRVLDDDHDKALQALRRDVAGTLSKHANRLATFEERLQHTPTSDELAVLEGTVKAVSAQMTSLQEALIAVRQSQLRIEDYLLNHKVAS